MPQSPLSAEQKDKIFRFAGVIKAELERSGAGQALVARSGLDLGRFGIRYSHAGVSLKASPDTPWSVRQLYFACDEGRPLIFDQGLSAFLMGTDEPGLGYVSVLLLPAAEGALLERAALDNQQALALLGGEYSANAYPFSVGFQNCNQWVIELLAAAWGGSDATSPTRVARRRRAGCAGRLRADRRRRRLDGRADAVRAVAASQRPPARRPRRAALSRQHAGVDRSLRAGAAARRAAAGVLPQQPARRGAARLGSRSPKAARRRPAIRWSCWSEAARGTPEGVSRLPNAGRDFTRPG